MTGYDGRLTPASHALHAALTTRHLAARPIADDRAPLPHELRENMALAALRGVVALHGPATGLGDWTVCMECAVQSWPPPEDGGAWAHTVYPCATVQQVTEAYGLSNMAERQIRS